MPFTIPLADPAVATAGALLDHSPPGTLLLNVSDEPAQTFRLPAIAEGTEMTVMGLVEIHPVVGV